MQIISYEKKIIYSRIPKSACSTIRKIIAESEGKEYYPNWYIINGEHKQTKFDKINVSEFNNPKYNDFFKFTFIRNPLSRLISCYYDKVLAVKSMPDSPFVKNGVYFMFQKYGIDFKNLSFDGFVDFVCDLSEIDSDAHFKSQHLFMSDPESYDFIGTVENFDSDIKVIKDKLGYNKKHTKEWFIEEPGIRDIFSQEMILKTIERYKEDYSLWKTIHQKSLESLI